SCAQDNCTNSFSGLVTSNYNFNNMAPQCGNTGRINVIYTVNDGCGNLSYAYGTFTIIDTQAPDMAWNNPLLDGQGDEAYLAIECETQLLDWYYPTFIEEDVIVTDECSGTYMTFTVQDYEGDCISDGYLWRFEY